MRKQPKQSPFQEHWRKRIINIGKTVVYDTVKDRLISVGLMMDGVASPVDVVKSRQVGAAWAMEGKNLFQVHERREGAVQGHPALCCKYIPC